MTWYDAHAIIYFEYTDGGAQLFVGWALPTELRRPPGRPMSCHPHATI